MVIIYEAYFKIALYPDGVKGFHFEEEINEFGVTYADFIKDYKDFDTYLCSDYQSTYVLKYLGNIYKNVSIADVSIADVSIADVSISDVIITDLIYETDGKFNCNVKFFCDEESAELTDEAIGEIIENTLWPTDKLDGITIKICGETFSIDICLDYFVCNNDDINESESENVKVVEAEEDEEEEDEEEKEERRLENEDIRRNLDRLSEISYDDTSEYGDEED